MANIKSLRMWKDICADTRIYVSKSWLGFKTLAKCASTGSVIDAKKIELSQQEGDSLCRVLHSSTETLLKAVENLHLNETPNGNYILEACVSRDGTYVALLLLQYKQLDYESVTDVLVYEGESAQIISRIL